MATGLTQYDAIPLTGVPATVRYQLSSVFPPSSGGIAGCSGLTPAQAVWYQYTTPAFDVVLGIDLRIVGGVDGEAFNLSATVFTGTPGALTKWNGGTALLGNDMCIRGTPFVDSTDPTTSGFTGYLQAGLLASTTYYIQFGASRAIPSALGAGEYRTVQISFFNPPLLTAPSGSILITSDEDGYPGNIFDLVTGTQYQVRPCPATEYGDAINGTGEIALGNDEVHDNAVKVFDHDLNLITTVTLPASHVIGGIRSDRSGTFYYLYRSNITSHYFIGTVSRAGVVGGTTFDLGTNVDTKHFSIKRDGTIAYYSKTPGGIIARWDLVNNVALSDLAPAVAGYTPQGFADGFVWSDDTIFVGYYKFSAPVTDAPQVIRYNPNGTIHTTYTLATFGTNSGAALDHFAIHPDDASFVVWSQPSGGSRFTHIDIATGATIATSPHIEQGNQQGFTTPWPIAGSCPLLVLPLAMAPPTAPLAPPHSVPLTFVPTPVPNAPQAPCDPQAQVSGGGRGQFGCNPGGVGWVSSYTGPYGSVPQHADPVDGETLEGKEDEPIDLWIELVHTDENDVVTTYRRAMRELADHPNYEGGRKPAGLISIGDIEHGLGNEQGGFEAATIDILYADQIDRLFRDLLDTDELEGDDLYVKLASREGRASGEP